MKLIPQTNQEAFDMAVSRLTDGTGRAVEYASFAELDADAPSCTYHSVSGHRCVVGAMLSPADALQAQKDLLCVGDIVKGSMLDVGLLGALQSTHDDADNWDGNMFIGWNDLQIVAGDYGIEMPAHLLVVS